MTPALIAFCLWMPLQEADEPLSDGIAALVDGEEISQADYLDYLWTRFGKRALEDMISDSLVEKEAQKYGLAISEDAVTQLLADKEQAAREHTPAGGFEKQLESSGQNLALWRQATRREVRRDHLLGQLIIATRVVTDQRLQEAFEAQYGKDGLRFEVCHILRMPNLLRAELLRSGTKAKDIDVPALQTQAKSEITAILNRARNGESFGALALEASHDRVTRESGGLLQNYDGRLYGIPFREAVEGLEEGGISEPVKSGAGWHLVQLLARHQTELAEVRNEVIAAILNAEPTWQEKRAFVQGLRARAKVQLW